MNMKLDEALIKITDFIRSEVKTETVIGKPFTLGEFTCVPVIRAGMGFGSGGGEGDATKGNGHGEGGGAGAGLGIDPIGFLITRKDEITFISTRTSQGLSAAFEKLPDVLEAFLEQRKQEKEEVEPIVA